MLLVNNPGDRGHVYAALRHAEWHGCTATELIFPFFLFVVGVSVAFAGSSLAHALIALDPSGAIYAGGFARWLVPLVGPYGASLAFAIVFVALWCLIARARSGAACG